MKKIVISMVILFIFVGLVLIIPKEKEKLEVGEQIVNQTENNANLDNIEQENIITENIVKESDKAVNITVEDKVDEVQQEEVKTTKETVSIKQEEQKTQQNINTNNESTKPKEETKEENKQEIKEDKKGYSEVEVVVAEKKQCNGNNHGMDTGNSGQWFETKDLAIATYKAKIKEYGDKWTNNKISDDEYYSNCPYGYEVWSCPYCGKWTINYYYDK